MRRGALLALLGVLWAAAWWSERGPDGDAPPGLAPPPAEETGAPPRPQAVIAAPPAGERERTAVAPAEEEEAAKPLGNSEAPAREAAARGSDETAADLIAIEGTVVVTDVAGVEHPRETGRISLLVGFQNERVEITEGRWTLPVPSDASLSFEGLVLGGRGALVDGERRVTIPASRLVTVRAHWPPASWLRIRSAETRQDLTGIELALGREQGFGFPVPEHPGTHPRVIAEDAVSPIDLGQALAGRDVGRGGLWLYARAEGFAWGRIKIELAGGGERTLDLVPGGTLHVSLTSEVPGGGKLRLRREGEPSPPLELVVYRRLEHEFESLLPGTYSASLELGDRFQGPIVLGSGQADVSAGGVAQITIQVTPPPAAATAPLRGTLVVDPAWGAVEPTLTINSIGTPPDGRRIRKHLSHGELQSAGSGAWSFDAGPLPHGEYKIQVDPFLLLSHRVDDSTDDLQIEIPAPAHASVRVIDGEGLEVEEVETLFWSPVRTDGVSGGWFLERDPATGRFEIRAPPGRIFLSTHERELEGESTFDLAHGRHEFDLVVKWSIGFTLALREGNAIIPWGDGGLALPPELSGAGELTGMSMSEKGMWVHVSSPGLYRFTLAPIDGYAPIPEQEVLVPERGFAEHVVQLERSP